PPYLHTLNPRFPTRPVFARPEGFGGAVSDYVAGLRVDIQRVAGAVGDVAEMAEQRALHALFDLGVRTLAGADAVQEVLLVGRIAGGACSSGELLAVGIQNPVASAFGADHGALVAVERAAEHGILEPALVPAPPFPGKAAVAEVVGDHHGVRRL